MKRIKKVVVKLFNQIIISYNIYNRKFKNIIINLNKNKYNK